MATPTQHYGLTKLDGESLGSAAGQKFAGPDRDVIDRELRRIAVHRHIGNNVPSEAPAAGPLLTLHQAGGTLPGGVRAYYRYTLVDPDGNESAASPETFVDIPGGLSAPGAPTATVSTTGGSLDPGDHYYLLSAYQGASTVESLPGAPVHVPVPSGTATNVITLDLPDLPVGATGFNVYRRKVGHSHYYFLASVDMDVATPPTEFVDDGNIDDDCERGLPKSNNTNQVNRVVVDLPTDPPAGYWWKLYRWFDNLTSYVALLATVTDGLEDATPEVVTTFEDTGYATQAGAPPTYDETNPEKVNLTDGAEVTGFLPPGHVAGFPYSPPTFEMPGTVTAVAGTGIWINPFGDPAEATPDPSAKLIGVLCWVDPGFPNATQPIIVDVNVNGLTVFDNPADRPAIAVGAYTGDRADVSELLYYGDEISVDVDQAGTVAEGLHVLLLLLVRYEIYTSEVFV